ncbi:hypothetical protein GCM10011521_20550 [Arenimonas soli]|uniref:Lipoprotein n=1 Tax=Arenimonas soli TaxID=2269504 RepID=A0ABQ1HMP6_9GAMM|nr:hypothetical protein [Arenimonas soli]GGA82066.1 hypothetical protein GCM10011521_20550 [Arenimonas soli]
MKKPFALFLFGALLVLAACGATGPSSPPAEVLFVGNSLTYVGNVPALYSAIATANAHTSASDMIVRGGATLHQRVDDGSVARALAKGTYTHLVIQERGGDLTCLFGAESKSPGG